MADHPATDPAPVHPRRRRRRLAVAGAALLVLSAVVVLLVLPTGTREGGPVGNPEGFVFSSAEPVGTVIATGASTAFNSGDEPAVLERVALHDPPPEVEVLDMRIAGPDRGTMPSLDPFDQPDFRRDLHRVEGYELAPEDGEDGRYGVALVAVMRIDEPGEHFVDGFDVTYRVGGTRYRSHIANRFKVCSYEGRRRVVTCSPEPPTG